MKPSLPTTLAVLALCLATPVSGRKLVLDIWNVWKVKLLKHKPFRAMPTADTWYRRLVRRGSEPLNEHVLAEANVVTIPPTETPIERLPEPSPFPSGDGPDLTETFRVNTANLIHCYRETSCKFPIQFQCKNGYSNVGHDSHYCIENQGLNICCSTEYIAQLPRDQRCEWRECGQYGEPGEVVQFKSYRGGLPYERDEKAYAPGKLYAAPTSRCGPGLEKHFVCPLVEYNRLWESSGCTWSSSRNTTHCYIDENQLAYTWRVIDTSTAPVWDRLCCPKARRPPFRGCRWKGRKWQDSTACKSNEVLVLQNLFGDDGHFYWKTNNRPKSLCCTPDFEAIDPMSLDESLATIDTHNRLPLGPETTGRIF